MDHWVVVVALFAVAAVAGVTAASTACGVNMVFTMATHLTKYPAWRVWPPYLFGSVVGSSIVGLLLGLVTTALHPALATSNAVLLFVLAGASIVLGLREADKLRFRLPQRRSQVNSDALAIQGPSRRMFAFGLWLGIGFLTYSPYGGLHLLAGAALLSGDLSLSFGLFAAYGLCRALTIIIAALQPATWEEAGLLCDRIAAASYAARTATTASLAIFGAAACPWP